MIEKDGNEGGRPVLEKRPLHGVPKFQLQLLILAGKCANSDSLSMSRNGLTFPLISLMGSSPTEGIKVITLKVELVDKFTLCK